ncbi:hypothetical protein Pfo_016764 [Paulownia fortunei]|nr:hypothetical protein Pfo_016764 [Paulownia fortunei]
MEPGIIFTNYIYKKMMERNPLYMVGLSLGGFFFFCLLFKTNGKRGSFSQLISLEIFNIFSEVKTQIASHRIMPMQGGRSENRVLEIGGIHIYLVYVCGSQEKEKRCT